MECFEGRMRAADGLQLFYRAAVPDQPRAALAFIHGVAEHSGRYTHVMQYFAAKGHACYALDLRGLGRSEGLRGHAERFEDLVQDVIDFVRLVREATPGRPSFLVGHSMGGLLVLSAGIDQPDLCSGIIASSPLIEMKVQVPQWKKSLAGLAVALAPRLAMNNGIPCEDVSRDPAVVGAYRLDPLVHTKVTARFYVELTRGMRRAGEGAGCLKLPLLVLQAGADRLVDPQASRAFTERTASTDKRFVLYEGLFHELFNEPEKSQVFECMSQWLEDHMVGGERNAVRS